MGLFDEVMASANPNFGSQYGDPDKSRVKPTNDYDNSGNWTEIPGERHDFGPDPDDPYNRIDEAVNHIDERWGENFEEELRPRPPHDHHGPYRHAKFHKYKKYRPPHFDEEVIIDTPMSQTFTESDVEPVYGYSDRNLKLLKVASVRTAKLTEAIDMVNDTTKGIDLVAIMERVPFASTNFRKVLDAALTLELQNYLKISAKIQEYMYGNPPQIEEAEEIPANPDPEPTTDEHEPNIDVDIVTPGDTTEPATTEPTTESPQPEVTETTEEPTTTEEPSQEEATSTTENP